MGVKLEDWNKVQRGGLLTGAVTTLGCSCGGTDILAYITATSTRYHDSQTGLLH